MFHEDFSKRDQARGSSGRLFGGVFAVVCTVVALWPVLDGRGPRWWALAVAAGFGLAAVARPGLLTPLNRLWTRFGLMLHRITTPLIMGVLFFAVITPFGVVRRLLVDRDPLGLKVNSGEYKVMGLAPTARRASPARSSTS